MLEGLDQVDWANLRCRDGFATKFPEWIRALAVKDRMLQLQAFGDLFEHSIYQGSLYEVSPYVVPFILELLNSEHVIGKYDLIKFLAHLLYAVENGLRYSGSIRYARLFIHVYDEIENGLPIYKTLLKVDDVEIREVTIELLSCLTSQGDEVVSLFQDQFPQETEESIRLAIVDGFSNIIEKSLQLKLGNDLESYLNFLIQVLEKEGHSFQLAVAHALARIWPQQNQDDKSVSLQPPELAIDLIIGEYVNLRGSTGDMRYKRDAIPKLLGRFGSSALLKLLRIQDLTPLESHIIARELLDLNFARIHRNLDWSGYWWHWSYEDNKNNNTMYHPLWNERLFPSLRSLSPSGKYILSFILDCQSYWQLPTNLFSFFYGLPDSRDELRALIEKSDS